MEKGKCHIDIDTVKMWKNKYLLPNPEECILTRLSLVIPSKCRLRELCKEVLKVLKEDGRKRKRKGKI